MLLSFSVSNYRSIRNTVTFSMEPLLSKSQKADNLIITDRYTGLKSAVIYGANASGKSNLVSAMGFMKDFILGSATDSNIGSTINIEPFKLAEVVNPVSTFEIVLTDEDIRYRYGFSCDRKHVQREWCFQAKKKAEYPLFLREGSEIDIDPRFKEGNGLEKKTRDNALFLSVVSQFNGAISNLLIQWFRRLNCISGLDDENYFRYSVNQFNKADNRESVLSLLKAADVDIVDLDIVQSEIDVNKLPTNLPQPLKDLFLKSKGESITVRAKHETFDQNMKPVGFTFLDYHTSESKGTQKLFSLSGPLLNTLKHGKVLVVDELDARLHPILTQVIVNLFNSRESNSKGAQLIFVTHDTNLINNKSFFRRDQIWFAEKDNGRATDIYSLAEYMLPGREGKVREDQSWDKDYIRGRYGGIPFIGDFNSLVSD